MDRQQVESMRQQFRDLAERAKANLGWTAGVLAFSKDAVARSTLIRSMIVEARIEAEHLRECGRGLFRR